MNPPLTTTAGVIGRAKTVVVFGEGSSTAAIVTSLIVQGHPVRRRTRPRFTGVVTFDDEFRVHAEQVVITAVDRIGDILNAPKVQYEISAANVGAASALDVGLAISGFSADVPLFLALLSARLQMPVSQSILSTGHMASSDGDICWVRHLPAKLQAARADHAVRTFIYPSFRSDTSVGALSPRERELAEASLVAAKEFFRIVEASGADTLVQHVFPDSAVVDASLATGFMLSQSRQVHVATGPVLSAAEHLGQDNEGRFWCVLEERLQQGDAASGRRLLDSWVQYFVSRRAYPHGFGVKLYMVLLSLPPGVRRVKLKEPLIPTANCIRLAQYAGEGDNQDVQALFRVAENRVESLPSLARSPAMKARRGRAKDAARAVDAVLAELSHENLARQVGLPIDSARAMFMLDSVTATKEEVGRAASAFYLHLLRHVGTVRGPADAATVEPEALALLERAFALEGGIRAVHAEAESGTRGGMRYIADKMTDQFKREQKEKYVNGVLKHGIDHLSWHERVAFVSALLKRLGHDLPPEIDIETPDRYAESERCKAVLRAYAESMGAVAKTLRSM